MAGLNNRVKPPCLRIQYLDQKSIQLKEVFPKLDLVTTPAVFTYLIFHDYGHTPILMLMTADSQLWRLILQLGWYSTGPEVLAQHREIHDQMLSKNESPLFLLLDPTPRAEVC